MKTAISIASFLLCSSLGFSADFTGTVKVDRGTKDRDLVKLAKVNLQDAVSAAVSATPGSTATEAEIDNERGFLVYEVTVVDAQGKEHEVTVDAGDSKVLHTKAK